MCGDPSRLPSSGIPFQGGHSTASNEKSCTISKTVHLYYFLDGLSDGYQRRRRDFVGENERGEDVQGHIRKLEIVIIIIVGYSNKIKGNY